MANKCVFSPCRRYRYVLDCDFSDLFSEPSEKYVAIVGLNPSIANENQLDPTLTRIRGFSARFGFSRFIMLNLFAIVSTDPKKMLIHPDPVGPENNEHILKVASAAAMVICAWGSSGVHRARDTEVLSLLKGIKTKALALSEDKPLTANGSPAHPLYLSGKCKLIDFPLRVL
jgi:hypothetical protein